MAKKIDTFAHVRKHGWLIVDKVAGTPGDGPPWFIGTGIGFDINRLLVYARNESDAAEIAEEKWPDRMGERVLRRDESEIEESGHATFFAKGKMYVYKESRIFTHPLEVARGSIGSYGGEAVLKDGRTIRFA